jgi:hypothetical protein
MTADSEGRKRPRMSLRVLSRKPERAYPPPGLVNHPQPPIRAVPEPAADIPQQCACDHDRFGARFVRPGEFGALLIKKVHAVVDVKEVAGHARQCASRQSVAMT